MALAHISSAYHLLLIPIPPFTWLGAPISTLDILAAVRLCSVMRQIRESNRRGSDRQPKESSFMKECCATMTVVYGGEALTAPWLGQPPSFLISATFPLLYLGAQFAVESLPWIPPMSFELEAPLTFLDALTRSYLLANLIPPAVLTHGSSSVSESPWTLLFVSFMVANGGFFIVNMLSMLYPGSWSLVTPAELRPYGWTTVDLWAAPLVTGLVALVTHAQPFWTYLHISLVKYSRPAGIQSPDNDPTNPWSIDDARALGVVVLWVLFASRTVRNFGMGWWKTRPIKKEIMRSRIDGSRYPAISKTKKTQ